MIKQMCIRGAHIIDITCYLGCSERTTRRHLTVSPSAPSPSEHMKKLLPFMGYIDQRLGEHVWSRSAQAHPQR